MVNKTKRSSTIMDNLIEISNEFRKELEILLTNVKEQAINSFLITCDYVRIRRFFSAYEYSVDFSLILRPLTITGQTRSTVDKYPSVDDRNTTELH